MLSFAKEIVRFDSELDKAVKEYIEETLKEALMNVFRMVSIMENIPLDEKILESDLENCVFLDHMLLPDRYSRKEKLTVLAGLYSLLMSAEPYTPTCEMSYIIYEIIDNLDVKLADDQEDVIHIRPIRESIRRQLLKANLDDCFETYGDYVIDIVLANQAVATTREQTTPGRAWIDSIFFDQTGFLFLDQMDIETLRKSRANKEMGILPEEKEEEAYTLPEDWMTSTEFGYDTNFEFIYGQGEMIIQINPSLMPMFKNKADKTEET